MDTFLTALLGATALLIVLSLLVVLYSTPVLRRGWGRDTDSEEEAHEADPKPDSAFDEEEMQMKEDDPEPAVDSRIRAVDLKPGDVVLVMTVSGSKYAFELLNAQLGMYHLRGTSPKRGRVYDLQVIVDYGFEPGQCVLFWSLDRTWKAMTTQATRVLVSLADDREGCA